MLKIYECQVARSDITELKILDNSLVAYCTRLHGIKIFDYSDCEIKKSIANEYLNSEVSASAFSPNSELFAFVNAQTIHVINLQSKEVIHTIQIYGEDIDILSFDSSSTYIIAGTKTGRVLQYKYNSPSVLARLCSFPHDRSSIYLNINENENFVSSFAFYKNSFACSGFGGAIFIIDLYSHANKCVITHNRTRTDALCFLDEDTLISGNKNGEICITSLNNIKTYKSIQTPISDIKQIIVMENPNYIMVCGKTNIISILDIKKNKIAHSKYIELHEKIHTVGIVNNEYLIVALQNKKILRIELQSEAKLKSLILHNSLEKAFELVIKEPMLKGTYEHRMLEEQFDKRYMEATDALLNQNKAHALQILDIYKNVVSKQNQIKDLFSAFKNYRRFQGLFFEKKYALAYAMCSKFPALKHTSQYKQMEKIFKITFSNAQRLISQNNLGGAKALLAQYSTVFSKKPIIKLIFTQNKEFVDFLSAVNKKDFYKISKLINTNELFTQIPTYIALNDEIQEKIKGVENSTKSGDIAEAKKSLIFLEKVPHVTERVKQLYSECENVLKLQNAYDDNDLKSCYKLLDSHKSLAATELGMLLENQWSKLVLECEEYALDGNIKDIRKTLGNLMDIPSRRNKIGDLIRVSFHVRIKQLINKKSYAGAETIIYTYIDIFGLDSEISHIMKKFEKISSRKLAITQNNGDRPTRDSWVHSDIIMRKYP